MHVILFFILLFSPFYLYSQGSVVSPKELSLPEIEKRYWICDYTSLKEMLSMGDAAECSAIYEELKLRKFNGNWATLHIWWKANKDAEYKKQSLKK